ncbi:hypothetical protein ACFE04_000004 [Oxalis oulophora]
MGYSSTLGAFQFELLDCLKFPYRKSKISQLFFYLQLVRVFEPDKKNALSTIFMILLFLLSTIEPIPEQAEVYILEEEGVHFLNGDVNKVLPLYLGKRCPSLPGNPRSAIITLSRCEREKC